MIKEYFKEEDTLNLYWGKKGEVDSSLELDNVNCVVDFDKKGKLIGIEIYEYDKAIQEGIKKVNKILNKSKVKKK